MKDFLAETLEKEKREIKKLSSQIWAPFLKKKKSTPHFLEYGSVVFHTPYQN